MVLEPTEVADELPLLYPHGIHVRTLTGTNMNAKSQCQCQAQQWTPQPSRLLQTSINNNKTKYAYLNHIIIK